MIFGEALKIRVKKFKQTLRENYSRSTKMAITECKLSQFFRGSMHPDPPGAFLVSQSASNQFCQNNTLEKNVEIMLPTSFKISRYATGCT